MFCAEFNKFWALVKDAINHGQPEIPQHNQRFCVFITSLMSVYQNHRNASIYLKTMETLFLEMIKVK